MVQKFDKVTTHRCSKCHRKIWVVESIIRGMGPVCFGKSYVVRNMLREGLTIKEIQEIPKEKLLELAKEELKKYRKKQRKKTTRIRKIKETKSKNQISLDSFIFLSDKLLVEKIKHGAVGSIPKSFLVQSKLEKDKEINYKEV